MEGILGILGMLSGAARKVSQVTGAFELPASYQAHVQGHGVQVLPALTSRGLLLLETTQLPLC